MWHKDFASRLSAWAELRGKVQSMPLEQILQTVNAWWYQAPWTGYYLHWDDMAKWPDPWQLLSDNIYCDVARGLGILYTITLLDHEDLTSVELVLTEDSRNLVLVNKEKYTLNWDTDVVVNNQLPHSIKHRFIKPSI
jgi:hypothetical protein